MGFIRRRVAQETTVHCWDAVNAIGPNEPIEQILAVDGLDEFLDEVLPGLSDDLSGPAQTICLHTSDSADQWTVRAGNGSTHLTPASDQADATVTATASDLLLLLWGRRSPNRYSRRRHRRAATLLGQNTLLTSQASSSFPYNCRCQRRHTPSSLPAAEPGLTPDNRAQNSTDPQVLTIPPLRSLHFRVSEAPAHDIPTCVMGGR